MRGGWGAGVRIEDVLCRLPLAVGLLLPDREVLPLSLMPFTVDWYVPDVYPTSPDALTSAFVGSNSREKPGTRLLESVPPDRARILSGPALPSSRR
jgi:hypothetical protein